MLRSAKSIFGYRIFATDGLSGRAEDIYFDDQKWTVVYLVVNTGAFFPRRKVLIFPVAVARPEWKGPFIPLNLTRTRIQNSTPIDEDKPVSRQHEQNLHLRLKTFFNWKPYLPIAGVPYGIVTPPGYEPEERSGEESSGGNPHLRSTREVTGYRVRGIDGDMGHVEDFIVDTKKWFIQCLVVNTHTWLPGRKVLIAPLWIDKMSWEEQKVFIRLSRGEIKNSPPYNPSQPVNKEYLVRRYDYYGQPK